MALASWRTRGLGFAALLLLTVAGPTAADPVNGTWSQLTPSGTAPSGRSWGVGIYDPDGRRLVTFGGYYLLYDTWALAFDGAPAWTNLAPPGYPPGGAWQGTAVYDSQRQRMLVFGGRDYDLFPCCSALSSLSTTGTPAWSIVPTVGTPADNNFRHVAIYDPVRERMLTFGGWVWGANNPSNVTWQVTLTGTPTWSQLSPIGPLPAGREAASAIYDPVRDRMLVFGGRSGSYYNDVWALDLSGPPTWSLVSPAGVPPAPRYGHGAIYDPVRDRMVIFGGYNASGDLGDVWQLTLSGNPEWSPLAPAGLGPTARAHTVTVYDSHDDRMIVFSGNIPVSPGNVNEVWALTWGTPLAATTTPRAPGFGFAPSGRNPSDAEISIDFDVPATGVVDLALFDIGGRRVRTLLAGELPQGRHHATWDRRTDQGERASAGVYLARLRFGGERRTRLVVAMD